MPTYTWRKGEGSSYTAPPVAPPDNTTVTEDVEVQLAPDDTWTKAELLAWCEEHGIEVPSYATKAEILDLIEEAGE